MIGLVLKDTGPFFCSKIISKHFHSALAEIFFKKILKNHTRLAIFRPHQIETSMNLENRISNILVYIRLDGATMILARRPVFTVSDQQRSETERWCGLIAMKSELG